jgi:SAM-dependent methyltransferase
MKKEIKEQWNDSLSQRMRRKIVFNDLINNLPKTKRFLDIGLGGGNFCLEMAKKGFSGEGIDISDDAVEIAKSKLENYKEKIFIHKQDILNKENDTKYDIIFCFEVLEHIVDDDKAINKIYILLKENGFFVFSVPAHQKKWSILDEWAGHFRRYEKNDIKKIMKENLFFIEKIYSYGFPLINILRFILKLIIKNKPLSANKEENTKKSGIDRTYGKKFKFLYNDYFLYPLYLIQKLFTNSDLSSEYLVISKKSITK